MLSCNERDRSSKFASIRKDADFHMWWFMARKEIKFYEHSKPNNSNEWATVNSKQLGPMWDSIPWGSILKRVNKLQSRIAKATLEGRTNLAKKLQYLLTHSFSAKLLAVKQVTSNRGKNTPGIDGIQWKTPARKMKAALSISPKNYKSMPLKRVYIEKKGKKKKRPLGIPTMHDRTMQSLYAMALGPISETTADTSSFGFRKMRDTRDAEAHIFRCLCRKNSAQWILEGDIKGCFDNINHSWLMDNIPMDKRILKQFLKAGFVYKKKLFPTRKGSPQGGTISPILANMTLDGIESYLKSKYWKSSKGIIHCRNNKQRVNYTRYADDCVPRAPRRVA
jgi:RNA-directed DNA polymerase